jgi:hypothetical protein
LLSEHTKDRGEPAATGLTGDLLLLGKPLTVAQTVTPTIPATLKAAPAKVATKQRSKAVR